MAAPDFTTQIGNQPPINEKSRYERMRESLRNEWSSWEASYRELGRYLRPRMPKFLKHYPNKGNRRDSLIVNNWGGLAVRTLSSGMMAGITSPSRPWFRLTTPDRDLAENKAVRLWLTDAEDRMRTVFLRSNLYQQLPKLYTALGVFGTGAMLEEEDDLTVVRFRMMAPGSFYIGLDGREQVREWARDFQMQVRPLVEKFGLENCTQEVKTYWNNSNYDIWIDVVHIIEKNRDYRPDRIEARYKKYSSVYYEKNYAVQAPEAFLRRSGYDEYPLMCPRWTTDGDDVYGTGPGWDAIGDVKELQTLSRQKAKANELKIAPPLVGDPSLRGRKKSMVPNGITYVKFDGRNAGLKALFDVNWDTNGTQRDIQELQHRISRAFYEDLFLMLANSDRKQITATEIVERKEEKLLALGPVLETLNDELLDMIIDRTFNIMMRRDMFLPPPPELSDMDLKVEYISIMAQAQKQVGLRGMEMSLGFIQAVSAIKPEVLDVYDFDSMVREYGEKVGLSPEQIRTEQEVGEIRQGRAEMMAEAQEAQQDMVDAETAKVMSETDTQGSNALTDLIGAQNEELLV